MPNGSDNVGIAFALVIGAGASTAIGAAVVFFPSLVKFANRKTLAAALGLSAGVMTFVSFVEIFSKSASSFEDAGIDESAAFNYATACFFGGVVLMIVLNATVHILLSGDHHHHHHHHHEPPSEFAKNQNTINSTIAEPPQQKLKVSDVQPCHCCSENPAQDMENLKAMADEIERTEENGGRFEGRCFDEDVKKESSQCDDDESLDEEESPVGNNDDDDDNNKNNKNNNNDNNNNNSNNSTGSAEDRKIMAMSINTAIAIGLHNFPEGLATFVATMNDPKVGAVLAVAIAIHNIPEGLCVALPIYYATGDRMKAFLWALLSGASEPVAALLGWAVLANSFSHQLYAVLFGFVSGMMVIISVRELLPTAHRYDPEDSLVTYSFIGGMVIMALSLVLFNL